MADNFDLQGWMRENKQGPFAGLNQETFKSSKPKSKTGLNESLMGMIDLQPVGSLSEDLEEEYMDEASGMSIADKWDMIPGEEKESMLDSVDDAEEGLADYAYMGWGMIPDEVKAKISDIVMSASVSTPEPDEDEKMAAMAMKQAKKGEKAVKGLNPQKDIYDLLYGDEEDDSFDL